MTHPQVDELAAAYRKSNIWLDQWYEEGWKYQSSLLMTLDEPLQPWNHIIIESHSLARLADMTLSPIDRISEGIVLINEYLTENDHHTLSIVLDHIKSVQRISCRDAMAYLIFVHTVFTDQRRDKKGKKPILFSGRDDQDSALDVPMFSEEYEDSSDIDVNSNRTSATWSIRQLVNFWHRGGGKCAKGLPSDRNKRWYYQTIPPMHIPIKRLKALYEDWGEKHEPIKAFLEDDPEYIEKAENYIMFLRAIDKLGYSIELTTPHISNRDKYLEDIHQSNLSSNTAEKQGEHDVDTSRALNVFHKEGKYWSITYKGEKLPPLPNLDGFMYISLLLQAPRQYIFSRDLFRLAKARLQFTDSNIKLSPEEMQVYMVNSMYNSSTITDFEAVEQYRKRRT